MLTNFLNNRVRIVFQFALPDCNYAPILIYQFIDHFLVSLNCSLKFVNPEISVCIGGSCIFTPGMPVPVATMNKNNSFVTWQNQIRFSGKI